MLSRTADNLFWMCRYIERAENTARMLDVNLQMSLLPQDTQTREGSWPVSYTHLTLPTKA